MNNSKIDTQAQKTVNAVEVKSGVKAGLTFAGSVAAINVSALRSFDIARLRTVAEPA